MNNKCKIASEEQTSSKDPIGWKPFKRTCIWAVIDPTCSCIAKNATPIRNPIRNPPIFAQLSTRGVRPIIVFTAAMQNSTTVLRRLIRYSFLHKIIWLNTAPAQKILTSGTSETSDVDPARSRASRKLIKSGTSSCAGPTAYQLNQRYQRNLQLWPSVWLCWLRWAFQWCRWPCTRNLLHHASVQNLLCFIQLIIHHCIMQVKRHKEKSNQLAAQDSPIDRKERLVDRNFPSVQREPMVASMCTIPLQAKQHLSPSICFSLKLLNNSSETSI